MFRAIITHVETGDVLVDTEGGNITSLFKKLAREERILKVAPAKFKEYNTSETDCECPAFSRYYPDEPCKHIEAFRRREGCGYNRI